MALSRRRFLEIAGLAGGALALRSFVLPSLATASPENPQLLLFCYLQGGWDQLLAFDPRPNDQAKYQAAASILDRALRSILRALVPIHLLGK